MHPVPRVAVAEMQKELIAALVGGGPLPENFNPARVQATAEVLGCKRARGVTRVWPALARALGRRFAAQFAAFASKTPIPQRGGPVADGRAFADFLELKGDLPEEGRLEALAVDLRYVRGEDGLSPRRRPIVRGALLECPRRWIVAMRLSRRREFWVSIPLCWSGSNR